MVSLNLCKSMLQKEREHCPYSLGINHLNCSKRYLIQTFEKGETRTRLDCLRNEWNLCLRLQEQVMQASFEVVYHNSLLCLEAGR